MLITPQRLEKALCTLAETDSEYAETKGAMLRAEYLAKVAESLAYKAMDPGMTVAAREREVLLVPEVQKAHEEYFKVVVLYEKLRAFRQREVLITELWRTMESSRRTGNIQ